MIVGLTLQGLRRRRGKKTYLPPFAGTRPWRISDRLRRVFAGSCWLLFVPARRLRLGQFADCFEQEQQAEENLNSGRDLACMTTHKLVESRQHRVSFVAEYYYQQKRYEDRKQRDEYQDAYDYRLLRQIGRRMRDW